MWSSNSFESVIISGRDMKQKLYHLAVYFSSSDSEKKLQKEENWGTMSKLKDLQKQIELRSLFWVNTKKLFIHWAVCEWGEFWPKMCGFPFWGSWKKFLPPLWLLQHTSEITPILHFINSRFLKFEFCKTLTNAHLIIWILNRSLIIASQKIAFDRYKNDLTLHADQRALRLIWCEARG